jgi:carboxyl-terminal processing protease
VVVVNLWTTARRALCACAVLALTACGTFGQPDTPEGDLFAQVYRDVGHYHLKPTTPDRLALASLQALDGIDPTLVITREDGEVVLRDVDIEDRFAAPADDDSLGWGELTGRIVAAARGASPLFAALDPDVADEMLIDGALATLDRFSRYTRPEVARDHRAERDGFVGVGVTLDMADDGVRIASVLPDTPAAAAGVHTADRILAVDGTAIGTLSPAAVGARMRGPKDSTLTLEIARAGSGNLNLTLRRTVIVGKTVTLEQQGGIAWLKVRSFNQRTAQWAARLLRDAHQQMGDRLTGIVLDLRDNPGGLLDQAVELADLFLDGGAVISTVGRLPESDQDFTAPSDAPHETLPLVVLVNGGSASSAEIVAAALQDRGRAVVVGTASFGKGTVQTVFRTANGGELTVTWAELFPPRGYHLHRHGVVPTICTADGSTAKATRATLAAPREALDDAGWKELRAECPPQRAPHDIDQAIALRLLGAPALYQAELMAPAIDQKPRPTQASLKP